MEKKKLLAMAVPEPTEQMMAMALADEPRMVSGPYMYKRQRYAHGIYVRTAVDGNIMAAALYSAEVLRLGETAASYVIYLDRKKETFLTRDAVREKWREATLEKLEWPAIVAESPQYVPEEDQQRIREFFHTEAWGLRAVQDFQETIRGRQRVERQRKRYASWDRAMALVPPLPKRFPRWMVKTVVEEHFIFYEYSRKVKEGYCTWCEQTVPVRNPKYNAKGRCPRCGHRIQYKSVGKAGRIVTSRKEAYLIQKYDKDKIIIRRFFIRDMYCLQGPNASYKPLHWQDEEIRIIYDRKGTSEIYMEKYCDSAGVRWAKFQRIPQVLGDYSNHEGKIFMPSLAWLKKTVLKETGLYEFVKCMEKVKPVDFLYCLQEHPYIEQFIKAGLRTLTCEEIYFGMHVKLSHEKELGKALGIDQWLLRQLREKDGGHEYLEWLRWEKQEGKPIGDEMIRWYCAQRIVIFDLRFILGRMSLVQVRNYLERQSKENAKSIRETLRTWRDYLNMAERLGMDLNDEIVYRTAKLFKRHAWAVKVLEREKSREHIREMNKKFPLFAKKCKEIRSRYEYQGEQYRILVPRNVDEIEMEGRRQHHCVGIGEHYFKNFYEGTTYILFLRRMEEPRKPHYTLEITPEGKVLQCQGAYNREGKDYAEVTKFLDEWKRTVKQRMRKGTGKPIKNQEAA